MANDAFEINTLYLLVSQKTGLEPTRAMEQTRVVCQAISKLSSAGGEDATVSDDDSLASGVPGSKRPLSESR